MPRVTTMSECQPMRSQACPASHGTKAGMIVAAKPATVAMRPLVSPSRLKYWAVKAMVAGKPHDAPKPTNNTLATVLTGEGASKGHTLPTIARGMLVKSMTGVLTHEAKPADANLPTVNASQYMDTRCSAVRSGKAVTDLEYMKIHPAYPNSMLTFAKMTSRAGPKISHLLRPLADCAAKSCPFADGAARVGLKGLGSMLRATAMRNVAPAMISYDRRGFPMSTARMTT
mmetsp:Transcript_12324/g.21806  ORF Transcript_12324/g.21806 Transcript_12324/m.21806 type:complete len:229 (-) Transcript_12324:698-1384(-)